MYRVALARLCSMARFWALVCLPLAGSYMSASPLLARTSPAAALAAVPFSPQLEVNPLQDAANRLRGAAITWAATRFAGGAGLIPAEDLMLALVSPEAYWLLREWRRQTFGQQEAARESLDGARREITALSRAPGSPLRGASVSVRTKGLWSSFHKATVREKAVHDVLAVRVVLPDSADVYSALDELRALWPSAPARFKDYVAVPKPNSYRGLHDTLRLPDGRPFEIQIRTESMHREAEFGHASHRKYKASPSELAGKMLTGIADGRARWPMQPQTAIHIATKLADA